MRRDRVGAWVLGGVLAGVTAMACGASLPDGAFMEVDASASASIPEAPTPQQLEDRAASAMLAGLRERVWIETEAAAFPVENDRSPGGVPYDCRDFGPTRAPAALPVPAAIAELVRAVDPASSNALVPTEHTARALDTAASLDPAELRPFERVVLQNTALSVVLRASSDDVGAVPLAKAIVQRFALDARTLEDLGAELDPAADRWIGPRVGWADRKGDACGDGRLLRHDRTYGGARAFRPIRSGDTRAIVAQLVAVDTSGAAHVTPFVGEVEVLRGAGESRTMCVAELDADGLLHGAPGGLRRVKREDVPQTKFVRASASGHFTCNACHTASDSGVGDFYDVSAAEASTLGTNRRREVAELLGRTISSWSQTPWSL